MKNILGAVIVAMTLAACPHPTPAEQQAIACAQQAGTNLLTDADTLVTDAVNEQWLSLLAKVYSDTHAQILCEIDLLLNLPTDQGKMAAVMTIFSPDVRVKIMAAQTRLTPVARQRLQAFLNLHAAEFVSVTVP